MEIFCLHVTGYLNTKKSFSNWMFLLIISGKRGFIYISLTTRIQTLIHMKGFNIFRTICDGLGTLIFQLSIMSKWLAKQISTKVTFKLLLWKDIFTVTYVDLVNENSIFFVIWNYDRTKIRVLPSFQLAKRLNSQNRKETQFIKKVSHMNLYMNLSISNWNNWSFDPT